MSKPQKEIAYMKTFTIDSDNNITVHASRKAARETGLGVFASEEQVAELVGPDSKRLIEIWNSLAGVTPVTKFASRKVATQRIWNAIQSLGEAAPPAAEPQVETPEPDAIPAEFAPEPAVAEPEIAADPSTQKPKRPGRRMMPPPEGSATDNAAPAKKDKLFDAPNLDLLVWDRRFLRKHSLTSIG